MAAVAHGLLYAGFRERLGCLSGRLFLLGSKLQDCHRILPYLLLNRLESPRLRAAVALHTGADYATQVSHQVWNGNDALPCGSSKSHRGPERSCKSGTSRNEFGQCSCPSPPQNTSSPSERAWYWRCTAAKLISIPNTDLHTIITVDRNFITPLSYSRFDNVIAEPEDKFSNMRCRHRRRQRLIPRTTNEGRHYARLEADHSAWLNSWTVSKNLANQGR